MPQMIRHSAVAFVIAAVAATAADLPRPGSPGVLTDWRWLARAPLGERHIVSDAQGTRKLTPAADTFLLLAARGPGVLDHFWTNTRSGALAFLVDGHELWRGELSELAQSTGDKPAASVVFPTPVFFSSGGMQHLLAPIGFEQSLQILSDQDSMPHYCSYRTFGDDVEVEPASADPASVYQQGLHAAADAWRRGGAEYRPARSEQAVEVRSGFVLQAGSRHVVLERSGSGELTHVALHMNPALVGSLRDVVVELSHDGSKAPTLRLPLTDLVGAPNPWPIHRWHAYNGDLAGGIRYPWFVDRPRVHYPEATFLLNLPIPFADGVRLELWNRSRDIRFTGSLHAVVEPLAQPDRTGRLCGTRVRLAVAASAAPEPLISLPGPGQLVGLGLFTTGCSSYPAAVRTCAVSLQVDDRQPVIGPGLLPLWFQGIYGGPVGGMPIWNQPSYHDQYGGMMRHFLTDPVPFSQSATFAFTPGPAQADDAPDRATVIALWYGFGESPYEAPALPDQAEELPHSTFGSYARARAGKQLMWLTEAEDLLPMARAHGGEIRAVEDTAHNYHPSRGKILHIRSDQPGDYVDCVVPFPRAAYFCIGTTVIWGPNLGDFELDVLPRDGADTQPGFAQGDAFYRGRVLGSVPMKAPVFVGHSLRRRRDSGMEYSVPLLNPTPDRMGVLRFVCRSKPSNSNSYSLNLDQLALKTPPLTEAGWREFECGVLPEPDPTFPLSCRRPKYGRTAWSGWGAVLVSGHGGGRAVVRSVHPTAASRSECLVIRGCLGPEQGRWELRVVGGPGEGAELKPGKDAEELLEWTIAVGGLALPGPVEIEIRCLESAEKQPRERTASPAELVLDAWALR